MRETAELTKPFLILVEGPSDAEFLRRLIIFRLIPDVFDVRCPADASVSGSGNTRFKEALNGLNLDPGIEDLQGIIIVIDNDEDEAAAFSNVQQQLRDASRRFQIPSVPVTKTQGSPFIMILPIPWVGELGNLETLCLVAAEAVAPEHAQCADTFQSCTGISSWPRSKRSKVKLRSIIAASYRKNPEIGLGFLWKKRPDIVPLMHPCFDRVAQLLISVADSRSG